MGYDLSADAFQRARDGWAEHLTAHRPSDWTYAEYDRARAFWAEARPDLIATWPDMTALRLAAFTTLAITWRRHLRGNSEAEEQSAVAYIKPRIQDADERTAILAALGLTAASTGLLALGRRIQTGGPRG